MIELLHKLGETPLPQIFIIAGIFFLVLSVVNKFGGKLDINPKRQGQAIFIGIILIVVGLAIYMQPTEKNMHEPELPIHREECMLSIYSIPQNEVLHVPNELCKIHISKGIPSEDNFEAEREKTKFEVRVNDEKLRPISEIRVMKDEMEGWHLEQFFEFGIIEPGHQYKITGKTLEFENDLIDTRTFYIRRD